MGPVSATRGGRARSGPWKSMGTILSQHAAGAAPGSLPGPASPHRLPACPSPDQGIALEATLEKSLSMP